MLKFCASGNLFWHMKFEAFEVPNLFFFLIQSKLEALAGFQDSSSVASPENKCRPKGEESWVFIEILL